MAPSEFGLGIEGIYLARPTVHEEKHNVFGFGREMRRPKRERALTGRVRVDIRT